MREMVERRPLLLLGLGLVVGLTALLHPLNLVFYVSALWLRRRAWTTVGVVLGLLLSPAPVKTVVDREFVQGSGVLVGVPVYRAPYLRAEIRVGNRAFRASMRDCPELALGDEVSVTGVATPADPVVQDSLALAGIAGNLEVAALEVRHHGSPIWRYGGRWRDSFRRFCGAWLPPVASELVVALSFGASGNPADDVSPAMKATGTVHLLSASGLHVFVIAAAVMAVLSRLPVPRSGQILILTGVLTFYAGATALDAPVLRASFMTLVGLSAYLVRRERDALSALALAAIAYLLWRPYEVYGIGFQLSFVTVGGMAAFLHAESEWTVRRSLVEALRASFVASVASLPLVAYHFGTVPLLSVPANLLVGVPASILLVAGLVAHFLSWMIPAVGVGLLVGVCGPLAGWVLWVTETLAGVRWATVSVPEFSGYWLPVVYGALLMTWRVRIVRP